MPHFCPTCKKNWKCLTDILYEEIMGEGACDLGAECVCYDCCGITEMNEIKDKIVQEIREKKNGVMATS